MHSLKGTRPYKQDFHKLITKWFNKKIQNSENTTFLIQLSCTMFFLFGRQTWDNSQTSRGFLFYIEDLYGWVMGQGWNEEGGVVVSQHVLPYLPLEKATPSCPCFSCHQHILYSQEKLNFNLQHFKYSILIWNHVKRVKDEKNNKVTTDATQIILFLYYMKSNTILNLLNSSLKLVFVTSYSFLFKILHINTHRLNVMNNYFL